ncbi:Chemotaxis protein CheW [Sporomusa carbonis]|uniref:chemotaxis protein CheW n=1 Tax=Sporomusa carbonis TaxID=3076075 RepID=UPI003A60B878
MVKLVISINLHKKFKIEGKPSTDDSKIITAYVNNSILGFLVDEVTDIITFNSEEIEQAPSFIQRSLSQSITGIGKLDDRLVVMLDLEKTLNTEETELLRTEGY